jgi:hypothetical protein
MPHPFVWHSGVAGGRKIRARAALIGASALTVAAFLPAAMSTAAPGAPADPLNKVVSVAGAPALRLQAVKIHDEGTVDTTFSNPMDPTKLNQEQFQAPHYFWVIPHTHIAVAYKLLNGNHTVRTVLDRGLHPTEGRCLGSANRDDPRCSIDTLDWQVTGAVDKYGQKITNKDWKVWTTGAKKHPAFCKPGCK